MSHDMIRLANACAPSTTSMMLSFYLLFVICVHILIQNNNHFCDGGRKSERVKVNESTRQSTITVNGSAQCVRVRPLACLLARYLVCVCMGCNCLHLWNITLKIC